MFLAVISIFVSLYPYHCHCVFPNYLPAVGETTFNRDEVIATYFNLKRVLKSKGLCRRKNYSSLQEVVNAVKKEISGSGNSIGYRQMHQRLITDHCLVVKRETVRIILRRLDPEGVDLRSRRAFRRRVYSVQGPNYMWHLDGYDKRLDLRSMARSRDKKKKIMHGKKEVAKIKKEVAVKKKIVHGKKEVAKIKKEVAIKKKSCMEKKKSPR